MRNEKNFPYILDLSFIRRLRILMVNIGDKEPTYRQMSSVLRNRIKKYINK